MVTEKELRSLKGQRVRIKNKFGGNYVGRVGTIRASKKWGGRLKVTLYNMGIYRRILMRPLRPLRMTVVFRVYKTQKYTEVLNNMQRSFFLDSIELVDVNPPAEF